MLIISEFFGIKIYMKFLDHNPPHFHVEYQKGKVTINIGDGAVKGNISERALRLALEWLSEHQEELMEAWRKASEGIDPGKIKPLD